MAAPGPDLSVFADRAALARAAAELVAGAAEGAAAERGAFHLVLAGGSTPRDLYRLLADEREPFRSRIDWGRTHLFWGDERPVLPDHPDSNFRMAHEALLAHVPVPAANVHRIRGEEPEPPRAAAEYDRHLREFFGLSEDESPVPAAPRRLPVTAAAAPRQLPFTTAAAPRLFDLALLGLGADGHTASLFPGSEAVAEFQRLCVAPWVPAQRTFRITLTPAAFAGAERVLFLVAGADKAEALARTLRGGEPPERCPALAIRPRSGQPIWLVDRDAARLLED